MDGGLCHLFFGEVALCMYVVGRLGAFNSFLRGALVLSSVLFLDFFIFKFLSFFAR